MRPRRGCPPRPNWPGGTWRRHVCWSCYGERLANARRLSKGLRGVPAWWPASRQHPSSRARSRGRERRRRAAAARPDRGCRPWCCRAGSRCGASPPTPWTHPRSCPAPPRPPLPPRAIATRWRARSAAGPPQAVRLCSPCSAPMSSARAASRPSFGAVGGPSQRRRCRRRSGSRYLAQHAACTCSGVTSTRSRPTSWSASADGKPSPRPRERAAAAAEAAAACQACQA
mmetsp:Transcript_113806/g.361710  ORF Transcript_113806/g.361710 Transcript_113806/m.361710 type:complete len:228 (-) Transcript_113806:57-740(-)